MDRPCLLQQVQRRQARGLAGLHHGFVFGRVFVRLEQDFVQLILNGLRRAALRQGIGPFINLRLNARFFLDSGQRLLYHFGRRLFEAAFDATGTPEIMWRLKQSQQGSGLLHQGGGILKIILGDVLKRKFVLGRKLPQQLHIHLGGKLPGLLQQLGRRRLVKTQHDLRALDLDALARFKLDLCRGFGFGKDAAAQKFAAVFKNCKHGALFSHGFAVLLGTTPWIAADHMRHAQTLFIRSASRCG